MEKSGMDVKLSVVQFIFEIIFKNPSGAAEYAVGYLSLRVKELYLG